MSDVRDIELLISAVQERPTLWDKRHKNYHNRLLSHREWVNVAKIIGTTTDKVKKKWKNLRDTFIKEFKKIAKPRSGADAEKEPRYTGSWAFFEQMTYLKVIAQPRKTEGNIPVEDPAANKENVPETDITQDICDTGTTELSASILEDFDINLLIQRPTAHTVQIPTTLSLLPNESSSPVPLTTTTISAPLRLAVPSPSPPLRLAVPSPSPPLRLAVPSPSPPLRLAALSPSAPSRSALPPSPSPSRLPPACTSSALPGTKRQPRKRKENDLEAFIEIEKEKMKILRQDQEENNDDDLLWFKSILPYMKKLPVMNKLKFRTKIQELLQTELSKMNPPPPDSEDEY